MSDHKVFESSASPDLRRTTRSSGRKRANTGSAPYSRPKQKKKMQTVRSPQSASAGRVTTAVLSGDSVAATNTNEPAVQPAVAANPFASLAPPGQDNFMIQMQNMMGGMLGEWRGG